MHVRRHRLFSAHGLGPGPAETLAALAEWPDPGLPGDGNDGPIQEARGTGPSEPPGFPRQRPSRIRKASGDGGRTVAQIAEASGKDPATIRRHLHRLEQRGLVIKEMTDARTTVWWRLRFDPDQIAERDQIPDRAPATADRHRRQRTAFLLSLSDETGSRVKRERDGENLRLVDSRTGEVLDERVDPELAERLFSADEDAG